MGWTSGPLVWALREGTVGSRGSSTLVNEAWEPPAEELPSGSESWLPTQLTLWSWSFISDITLNTEFHRKLTAARHTARSIPTKAMLGQARETIQQLRVLTAPAEDPRLVPSTHTHWWPRRVYNSSSRGSDAFCWPPWVPESMRTYPHEHTHNLQNKEIKED